MVWLPLGSDYPRARTARGFLTGFVLVQIQRVADFSLRTLNPGASKIPLPIQPVIACIRYEPIQRTNLTTVVKIPDS
jgi:hypothetical protein